MNRKRQILLFFCAVLLMSMAMGVHESIFNNFLDDNFEITAEARGWLEFPRELPGLLVVLMAGALAALPVTGLGVVGGVTLAGGLIGLAFLGDSWAWMVATMVMASAGLHLLQPVRASVAINLSDPTRRGRRMGQLGVVSTVGMILGAGFIWLLFDPDRPLYRTGFLCAAGCALAAAFIYYRMDVPGLRDRRPRLLVKRKYGVYYALELLFGARKQIFITFGPWVLIQVYHQPASAMAGLFTLAAIAGIPFKPLAGLAIDRFGERAVLVADGALLTLVCLGYGYAAEIAGDPESARWLACFCFICDHLLFSLGAARSTYVSRLTDSPQEMTSTLSMGISINHIVSMSIPAVAGAVWVGFGYQRVFLFAAALAVAISLTSCLVKPGRAGE